MDCQSQRAPGSPCFSLSNDSLLVFLALFACAFFFAADVDAVCDVQIANDPHKFVCGGQPFFWMGDTSWAFSTSELPCTIFNNAVDCGSQANSNFKTYIDGRRDRGFNVLQGNLYTLPDADLHSNNENNESPFCPKVGSQCANPNNLEHAARRELVLETGTNKERIHANQEFPFWIHRNRWCRL